MSDRPQPIACFISSHGFGHAARAASVMLSLGRRLREQHFEIFTEVPQWFFIEEGIAHTYHCVTTDVGLVQTSPLSHDIEQTLTALDCFTADLDAKAEAMAETLHNRQCRLVLCDISPLGIVAARKAGIPSLLMENFTWDWMYTPYAAQHSAFNKHIEHLRNIFHSSDYLIQTEPVCEKRNADLFTHPVSRTPRHSRATIRQQLAVPPQQQLITITMGGIRGDVNLLDQLTARRDYTFVLPGSSDTINRVANCIILPQHSAFYHPDLINASDVVVGKLGYSTLSEVYYAGRPYIYVMRDEFRESAPLASFVEAHMVGLPVQASDFEQGHWLDRLPQLLSTARQKHYHRKGAEQISDMIVNLLNS